jgi:hypothetical protein
MNLFKKYLKNGWYMFVKATTYFTKNVKKLYNRFTC